MTISTIYPSTPLERSLIVNEMNFYPSIKFVLNEIFYLVIYKLIFHIKKHIFIDL